MNILSRNLHTEKRGDLFLNKKKKMVNRVQLRRDLCVSAALHGTAHPIYIRTLRIRRRGRIYFRRSSDKKIALN